TLGIMKTLEITGRIVRLDTEKLSIGLLEMHEEDKNKKAILAFGMLDAKIMQAFEYNLKQSVYSQFSKEAQELFKSKIDSYLKDCIKEISIGIYQRAKMVV